MVGATVKSSSRILLVVALALGGCAASPQSTTPEIVVLAPPTVPAAPSASTSAMAMAAPLSSELAYAPAVKLGNQTNLNGAGVPFARYFVSMHERIHPHFAEDYLGS